MLSYALAIAVALSSLVLFLTAFVMSDIHRKDDFLWSGVGLLYALVLWFCARNITGTVLLGQAAASILLVSFCWQTLKLRKAIANPEKAAEISNFSVLQATMGLLNRRKSKKSQPTVTTTPPETETVDKIKESEISIPNKTSQDKASTVETKVKEETKSEPKIEDTTVETPKETVEREVKPAKDVVEEKQPDIAVEDKKTETIADDKPQESITKENIIPETPQQSETIAEAKPEITPTETETKSSTPVETAPESKPESKPEKQEDSAKDTVPETPEVKNKPPVVESSPKVESKVEDTPVTNNPETPTETAENQPSPLDSLETVEVAEVLEADPESLTRETNSDRNNIIEVKTTEIKPKIQNRDSE